MNRSMIRCIPAIILFFFACSGERGAAEFPVFDAEYAFKVLKEQVSFGTREPGSTGHEKALEYLYNNISRYAVRTTLQRFEHKIIGTDSILYLTNIIANFNPENSKRVLLCAHWDTRPWADRDPDPKNRNTPIIGANDGASGVAVLMEIARLLKKNSPDVGVDIVFFDGEDFGKARNMDEWFLGSKYFAKSFGNSYRPLWGILIDMVGDADLKICRERYSMEYQPDMVRRIWKTAEKLGIDAFADCTDTVLDDHIPLNQAGIPCVDIIDFNYPYWHTLEDTVDKCSPESLDKVGRVLVRLIWEESK